MLIAVPLELRQLHASPTEIGVELSMFGLGMFLFEWIWGLLADRIGYLPPMVVALILYAGGIVLLARADTVFLIALAYLRAFGMMVAVGPVGRSFVGANLPPKYQGTGLALLASMWVIGEAFGSGAGGQLIDHVPIRSVLYGASVLPLLSASLVVLVFRGYTDTHGSRFAAEPVEAAPSSQTSVVRVMVVTAASVLLFQGRAGRELALP